MNSPKSPRLSSAQFLLRENKYHVSLGEFVLSISHDKRKKGDAVSGLSDLSVSSLSKTLTSQVWVHDYLSRILHHVMLPALVAEQPTKGPIQKAITASRLKQNMVVRIVFLMVMVATLVFASTRCNENTFQAATREIRSLSSSRSMPVVQQEKESKNVTQERVWMKLQPPAKTPGNVIVTRYIENSFQVSSRGKARTTTVAVPVVNEVSLDWFSVSPSFVTDVAFESASSSTPVQEKNTLTRATQERPLTMNRRRKLFQVILEASFMAWLASADASH